jgi:membrane fusion protein (multidrug efflux system)
MLNGGCSDEQAGKQAAPPRPVVVMEAHEEQIANRVEALGTAQANESIDITPHAVGVIDEIRFKDNQQVKKGDVIVQLDKDEEEAQLSAATAQLAEHVREIARLKRLLAKRAAAQRDFDTRVTQAEVARDTISEIKARIDDLTLKAPFDGVLGIRHASPGALVQPGQVITTLDAIDPIKLDFSVPAVYLTKLAIGATIEAEGDALPGQQFTGTVASIDSRIDPVTRSILMRALIDNPKGLIRPGMLMRVTLLEEKRQALVVPEESVTQKEQAHYLSIVKPDNTVEIRKVKIGNRQPGRVEITDCLKAGEKVVVRGMGFLRPGQKVTIESTWKGIREQQFSDESN